MRRDYCPAYKHNLEKSAKSCKISETVLLFLPLYIWDSLLYIGGIPVENIFA